MPQQAFSREVIEVIREIPRGKVCTYGRVARLAGNPRAARQVARLLHACAEKEQLPWWRVVNRAGRIALKPGCGFEEQEALLLSEQVEFDAAGRIDPARFFWGDDQRA